MKMKVDEMLIVLEKIKMYKKEEDINFEVFEKKIKNIICNYKTKNTENLENLHNNFLDKLKVITKNHNNYILIIEKNIIKYQETETKVVNLLKNLDR